MVKSNTRPNCTDFSILNHIIQTWGDVREAFLKTLTVIQHHPPSSTDKQQQKRSYWAPKLEPNSMMILFTVCFFPKLNAYVPPFLHRLLDAVQRMAVVGSEELAKPSKTGSFSAAESAFMHLHYRSWRGFMELWSGYAHPCTVMCFPFSHPLYLLLCCMLWIEAAMVAVETQERYAIDCSEHV